MYAYRGNERDENDVRTTVVPMNVQKMFGYAEYNILQYTPVYIVRVRTLRVQYVILLFRTPTRTHYS